MIAIDVVLLPSEEVNLLCREKNKEFENRSISFDEGVPHISLAMGALNKKDFGIVKQILNGIKDKYLPLKLKIKRVYTKNVSDGEIVSGFEIENITELQNLHESILKGLEDYFNDEIDRNMLVKPDEIKNSTLGIIENFYSESGFDNFFPHITLGVGELEEEDLDIEFNVSNISVFQLGNYCTCRELLFTTT